MVTRILFLDIDGVLATSADGFRHMQPGPVQQLADIVRRTVCKIVLSSGWRHATGPGSRYYSELRRFGEDGQLIADATIGVTPDLLESGGSRSDEIRRWIQDNRAWSFDMCAVDDCELDVEFDVCTNPGTGLSVETAEQAVRLLTAQSNPLFSGSVHPSEESLAAAYRARVEAAELELFTERANHETTQARLDRLLVAMPRPRPTLERLIGAQLDEMERVLALALAGKHHGDPFSSHSPQYHLRKAMGHLEKGLATDEETGAKNALLAATRALFALEVKRLREKEGK